MKKETINTFNGGMIKDLHPLTTPNNVLTDALNATFITYNGNESILQNDMGNVEIKNALLKSGYVPVGMKEHGGIVYVAAYNPDTKCGQVGSFPSPRQLWEGENWTVNSPPDIQIDPTIDFGEFYNGSYIVNEIIKYAIFTCNNGKAREFHPGDKFVIGMDNYVHTKISNFINYDYMDIQLGVVKTDGGIEIMRTWSKDSPDDIFCTADMQNQNINSIDANNIKVFDAASSGQLILILNLHTFDSFSLNRKYYIDANKKINVEFTGEAKRNENIYTSKNGSELRLTVDNVPDNTKYTIIESGTNPITKTIYPNTPFGIVQRMGRTVKIDFEKIRRNQDDFGEWRFFVTEEYVKIGWSYDFYNLDGSKEIEYIRMYFHQLENGYDRDTAPRIEFQREYYNGNFEDYITYKDIGLRYRHIYIVEIVKKFKDQEDEEIITFKMLYLSKLYNSEYNGFYNNKAIGIFGGKDDDVINLEFEKASNCAVNMTLTPEASTSLSSSLVCIKKPGASTFDTERDISEISYLDYMLETSQEVTNGEFVTRVKNTCTGNVKISGSLDDISEDYIGMPSTNLINDVLGTYEIKSIKIVNVDSDGNPGKRWLKSTSLHAFSGLSNGDDPTLQRFTNVLQSVADNALSTSESITYDDYRLVQGSSSEVKSKSIETKGLKPLYSPDYSVDKKNRIAPYWNNEDTQCICGEGDSHETFWYNSTINQSGTVVRGTNAEGGCNDPGLKLASSLMGNPMTNMMAGTGGDDAELAFGRLNRNNDVADQMHMISPHTAGGISDGYGGNYLDYEDDDYIIACWKFTDGDIRFVNLITKREAPVKSSAEWPRLDVMLRCLLSQLFLVNRVNKTVKYITTDPRYYQYQEGKTKIVVEFKRQDGSDTTYDDIMVSEDNTENKTLTSYLTSKWNYTTTGGEEKITVDGNSYYLKNLIPSVELTLPNDQDFEIEVSDYFELERILEYYQEVSPKPEDFTDDSYNVQSIYAVDTSNTNLNSYIKNLDENNNPKANIDGAYTWKETPPCVEVTGDLYILRWNNTANKVKFNSFGNYFTTKAKEYEWTDVNEGEENEIWAKLSDAPFARGGWIDSGKDAPDMYYKTLFSEDLSVLKDKTG